MSYITKSKMAAYIDHTNLKPEATSSDIRQLCREAMEYGFASVCIHPSRIPLAAEILKESTVEVCTVCGFPLGSTLPEVKRAETEEAVRLGADEIDMVINIGAAKEGDWELIKLEIEAVVEAAAGKTVKVIIETCYLTEEEINSACRTASEAGAHYVKTSTGFGPSGASVTHVKKMKAASGSAKIKAAGGIRDLPTALAMIEAGADRIGTSSGIQIIKSIQID